MPQDIVDHIHAIAHHQVTAAGLAFTNCYGVPHDPYDLDSDDKDDSSYSPSDTDSNDASSHSDDDADPNDDSDPDLATATDNIAGVAEYDEEVKEVINNADKHIKIAGVDVNANDNAKIARVGDNHYPQDANYYPQAFHDERADDNEAIDAKNEGIDTKEPNEDGNPVVEMVKEEEDPCSDLEHAMDEQYGTQTGTYNLHPRCACNYSHLGL